MNMKNFDSWKRFINTGKVDDYLNYIACTKEETEFADEIQPELLSTANKEGGAVAGINYRDGDGSVSHAGW